MARISTYALDTVVSGSDILFGSDAQNSNETRNYTISAIASFIDQQAGGLTDTNFYLDGVTTNPSTGVVTFSVNGANNPTLTLGTAAFSATGDFAAASHVHPLDSIVADNALNEDKLLNLGTGSNGQILISDGQGGFAWSAAVADTNNYLSGITRSGNTLTFAVSGTVADQTFEFGDAAFQSSATLTSAIQENLQLTINDISNLGAVSSADTVTSSLIDNEAVTAEKIATEAVTEEKLNISNTQVSGYVLTSDGNGGFTWALNSSSNYYVNTITKTNNTITLNLAGGFSGTAPSYTFGGGAFADLASSATDRTTGKIALAEHTHLVSHITDAGVLAGKNTVDTAQIDNGAIEAAKLSPTVGADGQVLSLLNGALVWTAAGAGASNFTTLNDTPANYTSSGGKILKVNSGATGIEFVALQVNYNDINATNGASGKVLGVNTNGNLEWVNPSNTTTLSFGTGITGKPTTISGYGITDAYTKTEVNNRFSGGTPATGYNKTNWDTAFGWGNHASAGYLTSFTETNNLSTAVTWANVPDANITQSSVTQHQAALSITESQISNLGSYLTSVQFSNIAPAAVQLSSESFVDSDTVLMTAAAVDDLILSKNYTTSSSTYSNSDVDSHINVSGAQNNYVLSWNGTDYVWRAESTDVAFTNLTNEFKTVASSVTLSSGTATTALNFSNNAVFPVVLPSDATNTSITISSDTIGMTKVIKITGSGGSGTLTLPGTKLSGTLDQTNNTINYVQVSVIGSSEYIYTISQAG
tara:strand:+ start:2035 stop:4314 length:2280 start_codon:yes stop_codon:yes gene_type:complete